MSEGQTALFAPSSAPEPVRGNIYVGTCSWADRHFIKEGQFYPPRVKSSGDRLRYYQTVFPTVEIDATYYSILPASYARRWAEATAANFVFHAKALGLFTGHGADPKRLPPAIQALLPPDVVQRKGVRARDVPDEVLNACWDAFYDSLLPLVEQGKLGYVHFGLPPWYRFSLRTLGHIEEWRRRLPGVRIAVEFRHRSWLTPENAPSTLAALREHGAVYTIADEPQIEWTVPPLVAATSDWSVVRFHGRNAEAWAKRGAETTEVYDYDYSPDELRPWAETARRLGEETERLYLMFNNHVRGASARNAQLVLDLLRGP